MFNALLNHQLHFTDLELYCTFRLIATGTVLMIALCDMMITQILKITVSIHNGNKAIILENSHAMLSSNYLI